MQQWVVNYWVNYAPLVNWISVRLLLAIASIHALPSISIVFVLAFPQDNLDVYVFMGVLLGMGFYGTRVELFLKFKKSPYGLKLAGKNWFYFLKMVYKGRVAIKLKLTLVYFIEKLS